MEMESQTFVLGLGGALPIRELDPLRLLHQTDTIWLNASKRLARNAAFSAGRGKLYFCNVYQDTSSFPLVVIIWWQSVLKTHL